MIKIVSCTEQRMRASGWHDGASVCGDEKETSFRLSEMARVRSRVPPEMVVGDFGCFGKGGIWGPCPKVDAYMKPFGAPTLKYCGS